MSGLGAMLVMSVQTGIRRSDPMRSKASTIIHILAITYYGMIANDYVKSFRIGAKSYGETREADTAPEPEARTQDRVFIGTCTCLLLTRGDIR